MAAGGWEEWERRGWGRNGTGPEVGRIPLGMVVDELYIKLVLARKTGQ